MTESGLQLMIDLAIAFERRYRDTRKRSHCLSIEHRYRHDNADAAAVCKAVKFGEDALWLTLQAWGDLQEAERIILRISFGIGASSQTEYENRLNAAVGRIGEKSLHANTDRALWAWLQWIQRRAGSDFDLLFAKL